MCFLTIIGLAVTALVWRYAGPVWGLVSLFLFVISGIGWKWLFEGAASGLVLLSGDPHRFKKAWRKLECDRVLGAETHDNCVVVWARVWKGMGLSAGEEMLSGLVARKQHPEDEADFRAEWTAMRCDQVLNYEFQLMDWLVHWKPEGKSAFDYLWPLQHAARTYGVQDEPAKQKPSKPTTVSHPDSGLDVRRAEKSLATPQFESESFRYQGLSSVDQEAYFITLASRGEEEDVQELLAAAADEDTFVSMCAGDACTGYLSNPAAAEPLVRALATDDGWVHLTANWVLQDRMGDAAIPPLIRALRSDDPRLRACAAECLSRMGDIETRPVLAEAVDPLLALLRDIWSGVRANAATALGTLGDRRASYALTRRLRDTEFDVRYRAAEALGKLGDRTMVYNLKPLLDDPSVWVRVATAQALVTLGETDRVSVILDCLDSADASSRRAALSAVGDLRLTAAKDTVEHLLTDPVQEVREAAESAMKALAQP